MSESIFSVHKFLLRKYIYTKPQNIKLKNFWHTVSSSARHWIRFNEKLMTPECNKIKSIRSFSLSDPRSHLPWEIWGLRCEKRCSHWASRRAACCRLWSSLLPGGNWRRRSNRTWVVICLIQSVFVVCMNRKWNLTKFLFATLQSKSNLTWIHRISHEIIIRRTNAMYSVL